MSRSETGLPGSARSSTPRKRWPISIIVIAFVTAISATTALPASAMSADATEIINFSTGDPATDPGTEGIAIDPAGNLYVSANTGDGGQIWKVAPGATEPEVVATLIAPTGGAGFGVLGLEYVDGYIIAAAHTLAEPEKNGVWVVDLATGFSEHIAGTEQILLPNDLTIWDGDLYVTDSVAGAIWRIGHDGTVEPWFQGEVLVGLGVLVPGLPIGANGIDVHNGRFFVANLEKGHIASIHINSRGDAVAPRIYNTVPGNPDGLEVDRRGRPHTVLVGTNALVRVGPKVVVTIVDDSEILDAPASLVFGPRRQQQTIYVVNFSISEGFPDLEQSTVGPSIVAIG